MSRGANSGVDANGTGYEVDAVYETSGRSHAAYYEVDALYETSITAAVLCGCCLGGFCPSLGFFPALLPLLSFLFKNPREMWIVCTRIWTCVLFTLFSCLHLCGLPSHSQTMPACPAHVYS